jgi:hypothetical protein
MRRRLDETAKVAGAKTPGLEWHQLRLEKMMAC